MINKRFCLMHIFNTTVEPSLSPTRLPLILRYLKLKLFSLECTFSVIYYRLSRTLLQILNFFSFPLRVQDCKIGNNAAEKQSAATIGSKMLHNGWPTVTVKVLSFAYFVVQYTRLASTNVCSHLFQVYI